MKKLLFFYLMTWALLATTFGQQYHKNIKLDSDNPNVPDKIWSPLARYAQNVGITGYNWDEGDHKDVFNNFTLHDTYAVDINAGEWVNGVWQTRDDLWTPVYLPISGRVWVATGNNHGYGNTTLIWDETNGKVVRLAHKVAFADSVKDWKPGSWHSAGELVGFVGGTPNWAPHLHLVVYREVTIGGGVLQAHRLRWHLPRAIHLLALERSSFKSLGHKATFSVLVIKELVCGKCLFMTQPT